MTDRSGITILVVDDERSIVESLREILLFEGYNVQTAANGLLAKEAIGRTRPDLLLLDVMMPIMDGLALLEWLRGHSDTQGLPVIVMSAAPVRLNAEQAGYQSALHKPFEVSALLREIVRLTA